MSTIGYIRFNAPKPANWGSAQNTRYSFDAAAELQMSAGYSDKRNPVCGRCWERKSNAGVCAC